MIFESCAQTPHPNPYRKNQGILKVGPSRSGSTRSFEKPQNSVPKSTRNRLKFVPNRLSEASSGDLGSTLFGREACSSDVGSTWSVEEACRSDLGRSGVDRVGLSVGSSDAPVRAPFSVNFCQSKRPFRAMSIDLVGRRGLSGDLGRSGSRSGSARRRPKAARGGRKGNPGAPGDASRRPKSTPSRLRERKSRLFFARIAREGLSEQFGVDFRVVCANAEPQSVS